MAFAKKNTAAAPSAALVSGNFEKAAGFLNIYVPRKDGKRSKLVGVPMRLSKDTERQIHEYLTAADDNIDKFRGTIIIEYQPVEAAVELAFL